MGFALAQSIDGIVHQPASVADLGVNRGVRGAKADSQVARLIHRGTGHPAPGCVGLVGAFLKDHRCGCHGAQLKPAHACHGARTHSIVSHNRFVAVAELPIGQPEHQTVADGIQIIGYTQLGHTGSVSGTEPGKASGRRTADEIKSGVSGRDEIGVEKSDLIDRWTAARKGDKRIAGPGRREKYRRGR